MAKWNRNREGYVDMTPSIAIQNVSREERKIAMAKKRSCRRTADENTIHDKAVKMRKMTDEQLVHYVEDRVEKARSEGFNRGKAQMPKAGAANIEKILGEIANIRGIGVTKLLGIKEVLNKYMEACEMLAIGDRVVMNNKYYVSEKNKGKEFVVTAGPQEVGGKMCVWLEGYRGCYAEDGLSKVSDINA